MNWLLYSLALGLVNFLQALPLRWVARLGRAGGSLAYWIDARHRRVAIENLTRCFGGQLSPSEIHALAKENLKRLGENYACGVKTASMSKAELEPHFSVSGLEKLHNARSRSEAPSSCVIAIGHFGNFELYARADHLFPGYQFATTYRALKQPGLDRLLTKLRAGSGCLLFERRRDADALREAMSSHRVVLGLLSDQHAGTGGTWVPFFGRLCSTTTAPALFAQRYHASLHTAICYRTGLAQWRIEVGDEIPTEQDGQRRSSDDIMLDVNKAFEVAVRRDPANWFWVHKRWKPVPVQESKVQSPKSKVEQGSPP